MAGTICSECGLSFSETCAACLRTALLAALAANEQEGEEFTLTYEPIVRISPELDQIDGF